MNIAIDNLTMEEALQEMAALVEKKKPSFVVTPNVDHLVRLEKDQRFLEAYRHADLVLTDGMPLVWISRAYGRPIREKISGSDLFPKLCEMAAKKGYSLYFLGSAEGVAEKAAEQLKKTYAGLKIAGMYSPPYGFEKDPEEVRKIIAGIHQTKPDILIVCLGAPKQELFIYDHLSELEVPLSLGLGASLDFAAGTVKRAPGWMSEHGLEWLYRMVREPKRLAKRYLVDDAAIVKMFFKYRNGQKEEP